MSCLDFDDDLISFTPGKVALRSATFVEQLSVIDDLECRLSPSTSARSTETSPSHEKMSDVTDLLDSPNLHDHPELVSANIMDYLRTHNLQNEREHYEKFQWESDEKCLKYGTDAVIARRSPSFFVIGLGSKQLSPSDYLTRTSLYNRPVAFEKDSRSWARSLLDNFKKSTPDFPCVSSSASSSSTSTSRFPSYFPIAKRSSSFDHHVQYVEHLNECNDYAAYLEYLRENRSQLFCTLTDSIDVIDGLLGTVVSSF